jgi:hypothetical protein
MMIDVDLFEVVSRVGADWDRHSWFEKYSWELKNLCYAIPSFQSGRLQIRESSKSVPVNGPFYRSMQRWLDGDEKPWQSNL